MAKFIFQDIHILESELACPCCGRLPPDIYKDQNFYTFYSKWERLRTRWGRSIPISKGGGYRCPNYQRSLILNKKTKAALSPHYFYALDNDVDTKEEVYEFVALVDELFPEMRMGYLTYLEQGMTFVHIDEAYLVKPCPTPHWRPGLRW